MNMGGTTCTYEMENGIRGYHRMERRGGLQSAIYWLPIRNCQMKMTSLLLVFGSWINSFMLKIGEFFEDMNFCSAIFMTFYNKL